MLSLSSMCSCATSHFLTFRCFLLVSILDEHVPGALREEGEQQELNRGGNTSKAQHEGPAWTHTRNTDTLLNLFLRPCLSIWWINDQTCTNLTTCAVSQYVSNAQHLGAEDPNSDEELRNNAESSPQVFGSDLTQIHGHHSGRETCRWESMHGWS